MMPTVNRGYLSAFILPIGLEDESLEAELAHVNPNFEADIKWVVREYILPFYQTWRTEAKLAGKLALMFCLTITSDPASIDGVNFAHHFSSYLPVIDSPSNARDFYVWLWEVLFPGESYVLREADTYSERDDIMELNQLQEQ